MSDNVLLALRDLRLGFVAGGRTLTAVDGLSLAVSRGETYALLGESGCGKSVSAQGVMRLLPAAGRVLGGQVAFEGRDLLALSEAEMRQYRGGRLAMIFQEPATSLNPVLTVGAQIGEVLIRHRGLRADEARQRSLDLLRQVGIADPERRLDEYPFQMSGGMKQRVMIAIALAGEPQLLIADEPTTALDVTVQAQILDLLAGLQVERGMGMLLITHDLGVVARLARRIGVMYAGELVEEAGREAFFSSPRHPYTRALFAALPEVGRRGRALATIPGQVPDLQSMPAGCRFAARCPRATSLCTTQPPTWQTVDLGHRVRCHWPEEGPFDGAGKAAAPVESGLARAADELLEVRDLTVHFPIRKGILQRTVGHLRAVDGVSLRILPGRTLALVGESGCGKTTVGKALLQLLPPTAGSVRLAGRELVGCRGQALRQARGAMQMVFQDPFASLDPRLRVGEIIAEGVRSPAPGRGNDPAWIGRLLHQVGLAEGASERYPHEFSGGQRQRIAIARALAVTPQLLICDEPTSALDVSVQAQILNLLKQLQDDLGVAYLFITHNFSVVEYLAHEVAVMYLGRIVEQGQAAEVLGSPVHPYTQALLSAIPLPRLTPATRPLPLAGEAPSAARPPSGCHFHPRCPKVQDLCRQHYPPGLSRSPTHTVNCHFP